MNLKLVVAVSLFAAVPIVAFAQKDGPAAKVPKPTIADAQKLVQTVSGDKAKLQAYCDMGKLQDQMEQAEKKKDNKALEALGAKADSLAQQIGLNTPRSWMGWRKSTRIPRKESNIPLYSPRSSSSANKACAFAVRRDEFILSACRSHGAMARLDPLKRVPFKSRRARLN